MEVSKEMEQQMAEFQTLQSQLQMTLMQKQQLQVQLQEIEMAEKELETAKGSIFKSAGTLLIESSKEEAEADLKQRKEMASVRMTTLTRQEEKMRARLTELRAKLQGEAGEGG